MTDSPTSPNGIVEILSIVLDPLIMFKKTIDTIQEIIPGADNDLKEKFHWINCSLKNATQFNYMIVGSYFSSGCYWKAPEGGTPFSSTMFSCCNGDGAITGMTGGTAFNLWLDSEQSFKLRSREAGWTLLSYDAACREGGHIRSKNLYMGKDEKGNTSKFYIEDLSFARQGPYVVCSAAGSR
ncbi:uncharacterized protein EDB93DRAFT_1248510 [Suillus bovinus]|uniref:uncharacterized protein n=1 Tax=Suillus bovinus TaxID=48563 RepID=UPI001B87C475|nr:uncharacterized protein EDB93DRAFT_1248510 [Suillus bovinus]KAG2154311.1 hypothetical protein EDB93DRAFT_1248510 [Suillus bovinus]